MEKEIWKDVAGYEGLYRVSNLGQIYSCYLNRILKPYINQKGYYIISLWRNHTRYTTGVYRLVAETFLPDKTNFKSIPDEDRSLIDLDDLQINHKDEDKTNNCVDNLEWCTNKYNAHYGTVITRRATTQSKPIEQFDLNGNFIKRYNSITEASKYVKKRYNHISDVLGGRRKTACGYIWRYAKK